MSLNTATMNTRLIGLPPVYNKNTKLLILGTFPSRESIAQGKYYANPKNHFWDFMYRCLVVDYPALLPMVNYHEKPSYNLLLSNGIGLWDVIESCEREGNKDSAIKNPRYNHIADFVTDNKNIQQVVFTSDEAKKFLRKSGQTLSVDSHMLYSSSTMNTLNTFVVLAQWRTFFGDFLKNNN